MAVLIFCLRSSHGEVSWLFEPPKTGDRNLSQALREASGFL